MTQFTTKRSLLTFMSAMALMLAGPVPRAGAGRIRCCLGSVCAPRSANGCAHQGGVNIGLGTCAPDSCAGATTTTTAPPATTTTTTTSTTTTTIGSTCSCAGGTPTKLSFTTGIGSGNCGHLDADGNPNFFQLACGGLYFGGVAVGIPLPVTIPDMGTSIASVTCNGTTLTLSGTTPTEAGGNRCSGGTNHHNACTTNADCPGGACKFLRCTSAGCLFGSPLPIPGSAHNAAAISTCVINTVSQNASGTADCGTGATTSYSIPLSSAIFLTSDLMLMRCSGGSNPGGDCTGAGGCGTVAAGACPGGTCVNDTGRCTSDGSACCSDPECTAGGTCETGACAGGANAGRGCITDADCPSSSCKTFIQPCPICNATTNVCNGGPNRGLTCTPGNSIPNGDYPTSHDCPPPPPNFIAAPPIAFVLDSGTISRTAVDLPDQVNVFCGFCKNKLENRFVRTCNGSPTGALCSCAIGTPCAACSGAPCLAVSCASNADCSPLATAGFGSCGQRTPGAFTVNGLARTIVEQGAAAGPLTTGGAAAPETVVSIFCIPPTFNALVDSAYDLPGPGAAALSGTTQLQ